MPINLNPFNRGSSDPSKQSGKTPEIKQGDPLHSGFRASTQGSISKNLARFTSAFKSRASESTASTTNISGKKELPESSAKATSKVANLSPSKSSRETAENEEAEPAQLKKPDVYLKYLEKERGLEEKRKIGKEKRLEETRRKLIDEYDKEYPLLRDELQKAQRENVTPELSKSIKQKYMRFLEKYESRLSFDPKELQNLKFLIDKPSWEMIDRNNMEIYFGKASEQIQKSLGIYMKPKGQY